MQELYTTCQDAKKIQLNVFGELESQMKSVTSNDIRKDLSDKIVKWLARETADTKDSNKKQNLEGTAGSNDPLYFMYWTNEELLSMFAKSLFTDLKV